MRVLIFAWRNAPTKSSCFTRALRRAACAKNIFRLRKEADGDHLSSVMFLSCKSPLSTSCILSLSNDPSLLTFTLNVSITGVLISPAFSVSIANVPELTSVFISFFIAFSHSWRTNPSAILKMSLMDFGAGSQELASLILGIRSAWASAAQASARPKSLQAFAHPTTVAAFPLAYFGCGLRCPADRLGPTCGSLLLESTISL